MTSMTVEFVDANVPEYAHNRRHPVARDLLTRLTEAQVAGATVLWTEDLNHGQKFGSVTIQNPFHD